MDEQAYRRAEEVLWNEVGLAVPEDRLVPLGRVGGTVRVQEVGSGPPVVFLHGGPNSGSTWAPMVPGMAGFRCLLVDRPGTGLSEPLPVPGLDPRVLGDAFVADVLDGLGIARAHVVASSFGGWLALRSAVMAPHRFGGMVQMAAPAMLPGQRMPAFMRALVAPGLGRLITALPPLEAANRSILRQIGHGASLDAGRIPAAFLDWYSSLQRHTDTMRNERALIRRVSRAGGFDPALELDDALTARVRVPTHFLWGEDDRFGGVEEAGRLVDTMPNATLQMVPEAGHLPWLDDPALAAAVTAGFLQDVALAPA